MIKSGSVNHVSALFGLRCYVVYISCEISLGSVNIKLL